MAHDDYKYGRWRDKYRIAKADGSAVDPKAVYFVLRLDEDPNARQAACAYAESVAHDNPLFAWDILRRLWGTGRDVPAELLFDVGGTLARRYGQALNRGYEDPMQAMNRDKDNRAEAAKQGGDDA